MKRIFSIFNLKQIINSKSLIISTIGIFILLFFLVLFIWFNHLYNTKSTTVENFYNIWSPIFTLIGSLAIFWTIRVGVNANKNFLKQSFVQLEWDKMKMQMEYSHDVVPCNLVVETDEFWNKEFKAKSLTYKNTIPALNSYLNSYIQLCNKNYKFLYTDKEKLDPSEFTKISLEHKEEMAHFNNVFNSISIHYIMHIRNILDDCIEIKNSDKFDDYNRRLVFSNYYQFLFKEFIIFCETILQSAYIDPSDNRNLSNINYFMVKRFAPDRVTLYTVIDIERFLEMYHRLLYLDFFKPSFGLESTYLEIIKQYKFSLRDYSKHKYS